MNSKWNLSGSTLALAVAVALAAPGAALAQNYQWEAGLSYIDISPDVGSSDSAYGVDLVWFLEPVRTGNLPLAGAAFYTRADNLYGSYVSFDDLDLNILNVGGEYYVDRLYLAAEYIRYSNGGSSDDFGVAVGYVPVDGLRFAARYVFADVGGDVYGVDVKYLTPLAGGTAFGLEAAAEFLDDDFDTKAFSVAADYYLNPSFSLGARLVYTDDDFDSDTAWGVGAKYFFTPTFSGEVEYLSGDYVDTLGLRIAARF